MKNFFILIVMLLSFTSFSADYYWVGGSGNWSEINHWATTSGGTNYHDVVPSLNDDVYFDENSEIEGEQLIVTISSSVQACKNMSWSSVSGNTKFQGGVNNQLNIYGSLVLQENMFFSIYQVYFLSNDLGNSILSNGVKIGLRNLIFNGNGSWFFLDSLKMPRVTFTMGTINTNGHNWGLESFQSVTSNNRILNITNSTINIYGTEVTQNWNYSGANSRLIATNSLINFLNSRQRSIMSGVTGHTYNNIASFDTVGSEFRMGGVGVVINKLTCRANSSFMGSCIFDSLIFETKGVYTFSNNTVNTVRLYMGVINPVCEALVVIERIQVQGVGIYPKIEISNDAQVRIEGAAFREIEFVSSNPIEVFNSFNFGGNSGIVFQNNYYNATLYWVGGAGEWNDPLHWSTNNDGVYPASSGGCVPTLVDDVVFNENSGFSLGSTTVFLSEKYQFCKEMKWEGTNNNPTLSSRSSGCGLFIFGSLILRDQMNFNVDKMVFNSNSLLNTIETNGNVINGAVNFDSYGGWSLVDSLNIHGIVWHNKGRFDANGFNVKVYSFLSRSTNTRSINISNSKIDVIDQWNVFGDSLGVSAVRSVLNFGPGGSSFIVNHSDIYYHLFTPYTDGYNPGFLFTGGHLEKVRIDKNVNVSNTVIDTLVLGVSKRSLFSESVLINKQLVSATPSCSGLSEFGSYTSNVSVIDIGVGCDIILSSAVIKNIDLRSSQVVDAVNCVDDGGNIGFNFTQVIDPPQILFWVGGSGNWNDSQHWSLINDGVYPGSSGCVPKSDDDVVFNENSGFGVNQNTVYLDGINHSCHDMTWENIQGTVRLLRSNNQDLDVFGKIVLDSLVRIDVGVRLKSDNLDESIASNGGVFGKWLYFTSIGGYQLLDDLKVEETIDLQNGRLQSNGNAIRTSKIYSSTENSVELDVSNSHIILTGDSDVWNIISTNFSLVAENSIIEVVRSNMNNSYRVFRSGGNLQYDKLIFSGTNNNNIQIEGPFTARYLEFVSSATILRNNSFDTLVLLPGNEYQFESGSEQIIHNRLFASGTPCEVIFVSSTVNGSPAFLTVQGGDRTYDYARVKDINASRSVADAIFESHSVDLGGNTNIEFMPYDANEPITGFGPDMQVACPFVPFYLGTEGFYGGPATTYLWNDGSILDSLLITDFGVYHVEVSYSTGCTVIDSMVITPILDTIPPSITACPQDILMQSVEGTCEVVVSWIPPVASDNCVANLEITSTHQPGDVFEVGQTNVVYTFSDGAHTSTCEFNVTVENSRAPVFYNCPDTIRGINAPGLCGNLITWTPPLASDGCSMDSILSTSNHESGDFFPVGATSVVYTAYGVNGDSATCSFIVQVLDVEDPVILLSDLNMLVCKGQVVTWRIEAIDNCGIDTVFTSHISGSIFPVGFTVVTVTAIDLSGNESLYTFEVTVQDSPSISLSTPSELEVCLGSSAFVQVDNPLPGALYLWSFEGEFIAVGPRIMKEGVAFSDTGLYVVTTESFIGCQASSQVRLKIVECDIFIPESFSPNGDGVNDYFVIPALVNYPNSKLWVNDRWGIQVFKTDNYQNNWDGHSNTKITVGDGVLPEGTYYYILELGGESTQVNSGETYKGFVYLKP